MFETLSELGRMTGKWYRSSRWTQVLAYLLAVASVGVTALVHAILLPTADGQPARILFLLPILISAYVGGMGPGLVALIGSVLTTRVFHLLPTANPDALVAADRVRMVSLVVVGAVVVLVVEALHHLRRRAHAAQRLLEATLASLGDAVFSTDLAGRVVYLNREASLWTGIEPPDATGRPLRDILTLDDEQGQRFELPPLAELKPEVRCGLLRTAAGVEMPVERHVAPILSRPGTPVGAVVVLRDRRAQNAAELALKASELRYRMIAENVSDVLWVLDVSDGRFLYVSPSVERLRGYTVEEVLSQSMIEALTPESLALIQQVVPARIAAFEAGERRTFVDEIAQQRKDGSVVSTETHTRYVRDEATGRLHVYGISADITARRKAEGELNLVRRRYAELFHHLLNGFAYCRMIYESDEPVDWVYLDVNPVFEQLTGLREVAGRRASEVIPGLRERDADLLRIYGRVARGGAPERFETYVEALGIWFSVAAYSPEPDHFVAVFDNITARMKAEADLRDSEARLRLALQSAAAGAWVWDLRTNSNVWTEDLWRLYGIDAHSVTPCYDVWLQSVHPDDRGEAAGQINAAAAAGGVFTVTWRTNPAMGPVRYLSGRGGPMLDSAGLPAQYFGLVLDVTEQTLAEQALRESEQRFRAIYDEAAEPCYVHRFDGRFIDVNRRACEVLGYTRDELLTLDVPALDPAFSLESAQAVWRQVTPGHPVHTEGRHRRKDGSEFPVEVHVSTFPLQGQPVFMAMVRDITERVKAEQAMRDWTTELEQTVAERTLALQAANRELEAFSYSVSHDLRAPLRAVDGFARVVDDLEGAAMSPSGKAYLGRVRAAAGRMGSLIDDLLKLARITRSEVIRQPVDLSALARDVVEELREREPEREVDCEIQPGMTLSADARLTRILLMNLLGNAFKFTAHTETRAHRGRLPARRRRNRLFRPRQRRRLRNAVCVETLWPVPAAAHTGGIPRQRHRSGHRAADCRAPWR